MYWNSLQVLDNSRLVQMDIPSRLFADKNGLFYSMATHLGQQQFEQLNKMVHAPQESATNVPNNSLPKEIGETCIIEDSGMTITRL